MAVQQLKYTGRNPAASFPLTVVKTDDWLVQMMDKQCIKLSSRKAQFTMRTCEMMEVVTDPEMKLFNFATGFIRKRDNSTWIIGRNSRGRRRRKEFPIARGIFENSVAAVIAFDQYSDDKSRAKVLVLENGNKVILTELITMLTALIVMRIILCNSREECDQCFHFCTGFSGCLSSHHKHCIKQGIYLREAQIREGLVGEKGNMASDWIQCAYEEILYITEADLNRDVARIYGEIESQLTHSVIMQNISALLGGDCNEMVKLCREVNTAEFCFCT